MKYALYLIIVGISFCAGAKFYPDIIITNDVFSFVMAIVIYSFVSAYLAMLIINALSSQIIKRANEDDILVVSVISALTTLVTSFISLGAIGIIIPNFEIVGFVPKFIIATIATLTITVIGYYDISRR